MQMKRARIHADEAVEDVVVVKIDSEMYAMVDAEGWTEDAVGHGVRMRQWWMGGDNEPMVGVELLQTKNSKWLVKVAVADQHFHQRCEAASIHWPRAACILRLQHLSECVPLVSDDAAPSLQGQSRHNFLEVVVQC